MHFISESTRQAAILPTNYSVYDKFCLYIAFLFPVQN